MGVGRAGRGGSWRWGDPGVRQKRSAHGAGLRRRECGALARCCAVRALSAPQLVTPWPPEMQLMRPKAKRSGQIMAIARYGRLLRHAVRV